MFKISHLNKNKHIKNKVQHPDKNLATGQKQVTA
jgi:hypothetical protein